MPFFGDVLQSVNGQQSGSATVTFALTGVSAGNGLVLGLGLWNNSGNSGSAIRVTDSAGNLWQSAGASLASDPFGTHIYFCPASIASGSITVTVDLAAGAYVSGTCVEVYAPDGLQVDKVATNTNTTSTTCSTGSTAATSDAVEFVFAVSHYLFSGPQPGYETLNPPAGWTAGLSDSGGGGAREGVATCWKTTSATGAQSASWGPLDFAVTTQNVLATFKAAPGARVRQATTAVTASGTSGASVAPSLSGVVAGNLLVLVCGGWESGFDGIPNSVTDTQGNTWSLAKSDTNSTNATAVYTAYASASGSVTVTVTMQSGATGAIDVALVEVENVPAAMGVDQVASANGFGTAIAVTTAATAYADELAFAVMTGSGSLAGYTTPPAGWGQLLDSPGGQSVNIAWRSLQGAGAVTADWGNLSGSSNWTATVVTIKPASAGVDIPSPTWDFVGVSGAVAVASGNVALTEPAGVADGDLLVACIGFRSTAAFTLPAGWSLVGTQQVAGNTSTTASSGIGSAVMAYQVRSGAPNLTFTRTGGDAAIGRIAAYRGVNGSAPFDTGNAATQGTAGTSLSIAAGVTTGQANELLVAMIGGGADITFSNVRAATDPTSGSGGTDTTTEPSSTWRERADSLTTNGADTTLVIADAVKASAGATGNLLATGSASTRSAVVVGAFRLQPLSVAPGAGAVTASGLAPTVTIDAGSGVTASPGAGAVAVAGLAPTVAAGVAAVPGAGAVAVAGLAPAVSAGVRSSPAVGAVAVAGLAPAVSAGVAASPGLGGVTAAGQAPAVSAGVSVAPGAGGLVVAGLAPAVDLVAGTSIQPGAGGVTVAGLAPAVSAGVAASPGLGGVTAAGQAPAVSAGVSVAPGAGGLVVAGLAPAVGIGVDAAPGAGAVAVAGLAPAVSAGVRSSPAVGAVAVAGLAPAVSAGVAASPGLGGVTAAGQAPAVSAGVSVAPGAGGLVVAGLAPAVDLVAGTSIQPGAGGVTVAGLAPAVSAGVAASPGLGGVTAAGQVPAVSAGVSVAPAAGGLVVAGLAPTVSAAWRASPDVGELVAAGFAPVVSAGVAVLVLQGGLSVAGLAPAVSAGVVATPAPGAVDLVGLPPGVVLQSAGGSPERTRRVAARSRRQLVPAPGRGLGLAASSRVELVDDDPRALPVPAPPRLARNRGN